MSVQLVWLKRDLRVADHAPLAEAARRGPVVALYIYEPELLFHETFSARRMRFINASLRELDQALAARGGGVTFRVGEAVEVLRGIDDAVGIDHLWSHQETGDRVTYDRDLRVKAFCEERNIPWSEPRQHGVVRGLKDRDGWAKQWNRMMSEPIVEAPESISWVEGVAREGVRTARELDVPPDPTWVEQPGGTAKGLETLESFLSRRGEGYRQEMSSPVTAWQACSRLSPHLAFGTVSMRQVYQAAKARQEHVRALKKEGEGVGRWLQGLSSFKGRLHWHCHFMQKLEMEPRIEHENLATAYDGLREGGMDEERLEAWEEGRTGFPMVDACMRALRHTGWINFRMRAMLVSFASYHLWLHWRPTGVWLATLFLDYEPGIHWAQMQMQSGTTGINSIRIYNPTKQVEDHDPTGAFIRTWVPELRDVPDEHIAAPETLPGLLQLSAGCQIGVDYPAPIVDGKAAYREARRKIWAVKKTREAKEEAERIYQKHGSRRGGRR